MAGIGKDKTKEEKAQKKKMRKAVIKGTAAAIKTTLFPSKQTRQGRKEERQFNRELKKEFGLKKTSSIKTRNK